MKYAIKALIACAFFVNFGCSEQADNFIGSPPGADCINRAIKNEYLVQFKNQSKIIRLYANKARFEEMRQDPDIVWFEPNYDLRKPTLSPVIFEQSIGQSNAYKIRAHYAWNRGIRGQGVRVAIVDSGVDFQHPRLRSAFYTGWNFIDNSNVIHDETGHGTHIAGIIAASHDSGFSGIAPDVELVVGDFMNTNRGDEFNAIQAINWSIQQGAKIINNSWSNFCSYSLKKAFSDWRDHNVIFVNAAGNDGLLIDRLSIWPANLNLNNAVTVGSVDTFGLRSEFSNHGQNVQIYAPGEEVYSLTTSEWGIDQLIGRSGTSMATAYVTGALALVWSAYPSIPATRLVQELRQNAKAAGLSEPLIDVRGLIRGLKNVNYVPEHTVSSPRYSSIKIVEWPRATSSEAVSAR